jgi:hypothetical protein
MRGKVVIVPGAFMLCPCDNNHCRVEVWIRRRRDIANSPLGLASSVEPNEYILVLPGA